MTKFFNPDQSAYQRSLAQAIELCMQSYRDCIDAANMATDPEHAEMFRECATEALMTIERLLDDRDA